MRKKSPFSKAGLEDAGKKADHSYGVVGEGLLGWQPDAEEEFPLRKFIKSNIMVINRFWLVMAELLVYHGLKLWGNLPAWPGCAP